MVNSLGGFGDRRSREISTGETSCLAAPVRRRPPQSGQLSDLVDFLGRAGRRGLLGIVVGALLTSPATSQQLLRLGPQAPEDAAVVASAASTGGTVWGAKVDLGLLRTGPENLDIPTPDGVLVEVVKTRLEDRGDGNVLWIGRVAGTDHDHVQLTLQDGYLVGMYSEPHGRQFDLRARPDGSGRVESPGPLTRPLCAVHDPELASVREEVLARMRERSRPVRVEPAPPTSVEQPTHVGGAKDIVALVIVSPDVVYEWELTQGTDTFAEVQALFDYANLVFKNSELPAHVVAPDGTDGVVWAPLTLLGESVRGEQPNTIIDRFDLTGLRSLYGADVIQWLYFDPDESRGCGRADGGIWPRVDDGDGNLVVEERHWAALRAFQRTNVDCGRTRSTFVHEIGHSLGAQHDRQQAYFVRCEAADVTNAPFNVDLHPDYAYGCNAYGSINSAGTEGTVMSYARSTLFPYFSRADVAAYTRRWENGHQASNRNVLFETATDAADFFEQDLPPAPPTGLQVSLSGGQYLVNWKNNHPTSPTDLSLFIAHVDDVSQVPAPGWNPSNVDFGANNAWTVVPQTLTDTSAAVDDPRPGSRHWFVACVERHGRYACSEPASSQRLAPPARPIRVGLVEVPGREDIVRVIWDGSRTAIEDGFMIQARPAGGPWKEPTHKVDNVAHFVRKDREQAYVWDLDRFGTGSLEIRVCSVRILAENRCSAPVVWERTSAAVGFDPASVSVNEGAPADLSVRLSEAISSDVTLAWSTVDGSATGGSDYTAASGTLTIPARQTSASLTVQTMTDSVVESAETFRVTIGASDAAPSGVTFGTTTATVTIVDQTPAISATVGFDPASVKVNEGARASLTVRLSEAVSSDVNLVWSTADGSATAGVDYTAQSGALTIAAGRTTAGLTVEIRADSAVEGDERFTLTIGDKPGARVSSHDFDLDSNNVSPRGMVHAGGRFYVVDSVRDKVFAYERSGTRASSHDFDLDSNNVSPRGMVHAGGRFYVVDSVRDKVFVYERSGTRASSHDFDLDSNNVSPAGMAYADGRFYVVDSAGFRDKVFAYGRSGNRAASYDFDIFVVGRAGMVHAGGRFYVVGDKVLAYDRSGDRAPSYDFELDSNNGNPREIMYVDGRLYVGDSEDDKVYAYSSSGLPSGVTFGTTTATVTIVDQTPATSAAPTRLRVLGDTTLPGNVKLAWDDNSSNETGFVVEVTRSGHSFEVRRGPNTTSATVYGLSANAYYRFSVRALTGQVESDPSNVLYARSTSHPDYGESTYCSHYRELARLGPRNEYVVRMCWQTPSGVETDALDFDLAARDSGLLYFLERDNAEVLLKVLDFCSFNGYRWVFVAPVTTLAYRLTVSGPGERSHTFSNRAGWTASSRIHKAAFPCSGSSAATVVSGSGPMPAGDSLARASGLALDAASERSVVDAPLPTSDGFAGVSAASAPSCALRSTGLTLAGGYRVDACWQSGDGRSGPAVDWGLPSSQSGILYFFQRDNAEVLVKVLDGCGVNNRRWVFVAPVTDLGLRLRVTAPDGTRWDYGNRVGSVAVPRSDTNAFACR